MSLVLLRLLQYKPLCWSVESSVVDQLSAMKILQP